MIQEGIRLAVERKDLSTEMARGIMDEMMTGSASTAQMAAFLTAMRMKGETKEELLGFVSCMRSRACRISAPEGTVDLCGTGGDGARTFNISTVASFVVAGCGVPVAKHGNKAISSRCGSADVLASIGIPVMLDQLAVERCLHEAGIGFMFAPRFHESMKNVMPARRDVAIRTFFNLLGPMTNPAGVKRQLMGVYDPRVARTVAEVLNDLGTEHAMIVHGSGMDEITNTGPTEVAELKNGDIREYEITPEEFGVERVAPKALAGGTADENARIMLSILKGEPSPRADVVAMNAGAAIMISGKAMDLNEGFEIAREAIRSGEALGTLRSFGDRSNTLEEEAQRTMSVPDLRSRRVLPATLRTRSREITADLIGRISEMPGGRRHLEDLDESLLLDPSVLSVLTLSRVSRVLGGELDGIPTRPSDADARFSEAIEEARGIAIIGEYKPRSPSTSGLHIPPDPDRTAAAYSDGGVASMSVLVEGDFFGGGIDLFSRLRARTAMPMLFKDFVTTETQLNAAAAVGANSVLLIAKALKQETLSLLVDTSLGNGLEPLVEIHDAIDLEKVTSCESCDRIGLIGINGRDLRTLEVSLDRVRSLRKSIPKDKLVVAESGIRTPADVKTLKGFDAALIGSMFMSSDSLEETVRETVRLASEVQD